MPREQCQSGATSQKQARTAWSATETVLAPNKSLWRSDPLSECC